MLSPSPRSHYGAGSMSVPGGSPLGVFKWVAQRRGQQLRRVQMMPSCPPLQPLHPASADGSFWFHVCRRKRARPDEDAIDGGTGGRQQGEEDMMVSAKDLYSQRHRVEERWKKGPFLHKPLVHEDCSIVCLQVRRCLSRPCSPSPAPLHAACCANASPVRRRQPPVVRSLFWRGTRHHG